MLPAATNPNEVVVGPAGVVLLTEKVTRVAIEKAADGREMETAPMLVLPPVPLGRINPVGIIPIQVDSKRKENRTPEGLRSTTSLDQKSPAVPEIPTADHVDQAARSRRSEHNRISAKKRLLAV